MSEIVIRKRLIQVEDIFHEGGTPAKQPLRRGAGLCRVEQGREARLLDEGDAEAEVHRDRLGQVDLVTPSGDDLAALHGADLEAVARHVERHRERAGGRGDRSRGCGRREGGEQGGGEAGEDAAGGHEVARTRTGVPTARKSKSHFASNEVWRTQPCDAGLTGTSGYSWNAMPPTKEAA